MTHSNPPNICAPKVCWLPRLLVVFMAFYLLDFAHPHLVPEHLANPKIQLHDSGASCLGVTNCLHFADFFCLPVLFPTADPDTSLSVFPLSCVCRCTCFTFIFHAWGYDTTHYGDVIFITGAGLRDHTHTTQFETMRLVHSACFDCLLSRGKVAGSLKRHWTKDCI